MRRLWPDPLDDVEIDALIAAEARPAPSDRPWLLVNMISSLDGAVTVEGHSGGLGRPADRAVFSALRAVADVVLAGAGTVRAEDYGPARPTTAQRRARLERGQEEVPPVAVVSRSLELDPSARLFRSPGPRPIVVTCAGAPAERRRALEPVADVVVAGEATVDLPGALSALAARGMAIATCEGGPRLNGDLVAADLIDEWALTVSPMLVGGPADRSVVGGGHGGVRGYVLDRLLEGDGLLLGRWVRER